MRCKLKTIQESLIVYIWHLLYKSVVNLTEILWRCCRGLCLSGEHERRKIYLIVKLPNKMHNKLNRVLAVSNSLTTKEQWISFILPAQQSSFFGANATHWDTCQTHFEERLKATGRSSERCFGDTYLEPTLTNIQFSFPRRSRLFFLSISLQFDFSIFCLSEIYGSAYVPAMFCHWCCLWSIYNPTKFCHIPDICHKMSNRQGKFSVMCTPGHNIIRESFEI